MQINNPDEYDVHILDRINPIIEKNNLSLMNYNERKFVNGIIRQLKPKKILEIGIANGGGSSVILNAIQDMPETKLYSIDILLKHWIYKDKKIGFVVEEYFNYLIKNNWQIYLGGVVAKFIEEIGDGIDLCIIDAYHYLPGEMLDFLMVLPFLKENATIIIHDTLLGALGYAGYYPYGISCMVLFTTLKGKKYTIKKNIFNEIGNIGAVTLSSDFKSYMFDYFYSLTYPWHSPIDEDSLTYILNLFNKFYDKKYVDLFNEIVNFYSKDGKYTKNLQEINEILFYYQRLVNEYQNKIINNETFKLNWNILFGIGINHNYLIVKFFGIKITFKVDEKIINKIAWWIPIKKWRDNFRDKFKRSDQIRSDQIRSDQIEICEEYIYINNNIIINKLQPMLQYNKAA